MTHHRAFNWLLAGIIALLLGSVYRLDGPTDHQAQADQLADMQAIAKAEAAQQRMASAAQAICGDNAGWQLVDATTVQCTTKRRHRTHRGAL